jgi:hypothetical protein
LSSASLAGIDSDQGRSKAIKLMLVEIAQKRDSSNCAP